MMMCRRSLRQRAYRRAGCRKGDTRRTYYTRWYRRRVTRVGVRISMGLGKKYCKTILRSKTLFRPLPPLCVALGSVSLSLWIFRLCLALMMCLFYYVENQEIKDGNLPKMMQEIDHFLKYLKQNHRRRQRKVGQRK